MPRPRFQKAPLEKRDALLDAAAHEFAAEGYDNASVNRILLAAGFSKGSFYYYFDDKPDLAAAVIEREATQYAGLWSELRKPRTAREFWREIERLTELSAARLRHAPPGSTDALFRLGAALPRHPEILPRLSGEAFAEITAKMTALWKHGQKIGALRTDLPLSTLIALLQETKLSLIRLVLPLDRGPTSQEIEAFARLHLDIVRRISEAR